MGLELRTYIYAPTLCVCVCVCARARVRAAAALAKLCGCTGSHEPPLLACAIIINQECHYNIMLVIEYMAINDNIFFYKSWPYW